MSQKIVSTYSGSFAPDDPVKVQGEVIATVLRQALDEAAELGGHEQQVERVSFELGDEAVSWSGSALAVPFSVQVVTKLR